MRIASNHDLETVEMRKAFVETLIQEGNKNSRIVTVNSDLCSSMGITDFVKIFPDRSFNVGIQESNGVGVSAGLSAAGMIPFFHTFAVFASRRVFDQAFVSCAYAGLNVKIVGGDPGVTATTNGGTHMSFEDIALMRAIPTARVIEFSDTTMVRKVVPQVVEHYGVDYMRLMRKCLHRIYDESSEIIVGKANVLREGTDVTIIACGLEVYEALTAAQQLEEEGISARVVDMFTIKPLDNECVIESAKKTGAIVTAENHNIINGLGSAVAEVLVENIPVPMERVGAQDEFGEVGPQNYLMERFNLTSKTIYEKAKRVISRK
ncbi:MAG: transketolase C-terminal domain-containing protein [Eubacteriales bacterium]|nr:transketolase C-terminal domain-containing protein [Eubacteriales bacterium]